VELDLSPAACRVLGSLLEKEVTVPATYPMTMNGLVGACNQTSGRDPITHFDEREVDAALTELRSLGLTRVLHPGPGSRTTKYRQVAHEVLALDGGERAVVTLLLLRGPQTPGELRSRSGRLHAFGVVSEVDEILEALVGRPDPLVAELPRQPGQKESRWRHLLGPEPESVGAGGRAAAAPPPAPAPPATPAAPATPAPVAVPPEAAPLAPFAGTWRGAGAGEYPTIEPFAYTQEIVLHPVPGKAFLAYRSTTRHATEDRPLHAESGFLRLVGDGGVELVVAQANGIVEIGEGLLDGGELLLASTTVRGSSTAKEATAVERRYQVDGDQLTYDLAMAAVGHPLTHHLRARLRRAT
jgi:uncharacterized protein YceH (UPF0502 family)